MNYDFKVGFWRRLNLKSAIKRKDDRVSWGGTLLQKLPSDCFAMQKLLCRCRPQVLVELGSNHGGSAAFFSSIAPLAGMELIVSVDILDLPKPKPPLVKFLLGDSTSLEMVNQIKTLLGQRSCSVVVDSNHSAPHVDKEMAFYAPLVTPGQALILEDTLVDVLDYRKFREQGGPLRSIKKYMPQHPEFELAEDIEPYLTSNFFGYWVRKK